jgi:hypothetical protein
MFGFSRLHLDASDFRIVDGLDIASDIPGFRKHQLYRWSVERIMVIICAFVAGTLALNLAGFSLTSGAQGQPPRFQRPAIRALAITDSFSPPPKLKKRRPRGPRSEPPPGPRSTETETETETQTEIESTAAEPQRPPRRQESSHSVRAKIPTSEYGEEAKGADEDQDDKPIIRKKIARKRMVKHEPQEAQEDDEEEEEEAEKENGDQEQTPASFPVILPRLISFHAGVAAIGRSFEYNTPLQRETTFPRIGLALSFEAFPLIRTSRDWWARIGVGAAFSKEIGMAALVQQNNGVTNGASVGFPVVQQRWSFDLRYALALGSRVLLVPAVGMGFNSFDLQNRTPTAPSMCANVAATAVPCLADVDTSYLEGDVHLRASVLPQIGVSLTAGYFIGIKVGKGVGQIGQERNAILSGLHAEPAANVMVTDWMAIRMAVPFIRYAYQFGGGTTGAYSSATETYYGATVGAIVFVP